MLPVGAIAPDFSLPNQHRSTVRLSDFRGKKHVVLAFHPLAFTPVCSAQVQTYERERPRLDALDAHVLVDQQRRGTVEKGVGRLARRRVVQTC